MGAGKVVDAHTHSGGADSTAKKESITPAFPAISSYSRSGYGDTKKKKSTRSKGNAKLRVIECPSPTAGS